MKLHIKVFAASFSITCLYVLIVWLICPRVNWITTGALGLAACILTQVVAYRYWKNITKQQ